MGKVKKFEPII